VWLAACLLASLAFAPSAHSARRKEHREPLAVAKKAQPIELLHVTTHASFNLQPDQRTGRFSPRVMRSMRTLLKCHHTGKQHTISRRLIEVLYSTARHFHSDKLYVIAGYRAPRIAKQKGNPKSPHKRGVACDFRLDNVSNETVRDYLRSKYRDIGVGYYPNSGFVHVDVERKKPAYWIDYSGPGERARYARSGAPQKPDQEEGSDSDNDRAE
jgi:uncharacterized protein YcbK (DUF882 family)